MKILLAYFSNTGNTRSIANMLRADLDSSHEVTVAEIKPQKTYSYWFWLILSFIPGSRVPIEEITEDVGDFDLIFLGVPKWTFSCPPVNGYLRLLRNQIGKPFAVWVCYGGFDHKRFVRRLLKTLRGFKVRLVCWTLIRRSTVLDSTCRSEVLRFCREALSAVGCDQTHG